jgi:prophage regulatory protein
MTIIGIERVIEKTTLGRSTLYTYMRDGKFPASVRLGDRHVGWVEAEVDGWLQARINARRNTQQEELAAA